MSVVFAACAVKNEAVCSPANSWHTPIYKCVTGESAPEAEPVVASVPEPEPEPASNVVVRDDRIEILQRVQFESGSADIRPESFALLDEVAAALTTNSAIAEVRVEGHTDSRGSAGLNRRLSKARAAAVRKYLADKGIAPERLTSQGFGPDKPIADNETEDGRLQNRRVEFKILRRN